MTLCYLYSSITHFIEFISVTMSPSLCVYVCLSDYAENEALRYM